MAELSADQRDRLLSIFLTEYNRLRGTCFELKHLVEVRDAACDYHFIDPDNHELKIQWTTPPTDAEVKKHLRRDSSFINQLKAKLDELGVHGIGIGISYNDLPYDNRILSELTSQLAQFIESIASASLTSEVDLNNHQIRIASPFIGMYISELTLIRFPRRNLKPLIIYNPCIASYVPPSAQRAKDAFIHKNYRYGPSAHDLVLVIQFELDLYEDDEIEGIRHSLKHISSNFREVWIIYDSLSRQARADCIKN